MASPKESGEDVSSAVSSSDVVSPSTDNDDNERYELLDNVHSDFLQHFENEIRISQPDLKAGGAAAVPDSSGIRSSTQLQQCIADKQLQQHLADSNTPSSGLFGSDDAADVLSTPDPYVVSNFVGAATDMYIISPPLSSRIEGYVCF